MYSILNLLFVKSCRYNKLIKFLVKPCCTVSDRNIIKLKKRFAYLR